MNREKAKELADILTAYANGTELQKLIEIRLG